MMESSHPSQRQAAKHWRSLQLPLVRWSGERDGHKEEMLDSEVEPEGEVARGSRRNKTTVVHGQLLGDGAGLSTVNRTLPGLCALATGSHALGSGPKKGANLAG